ncbi:hypothetical protein ABIB73_007348 [Bradyrhizobium sp. F1.4.3]
MFAQMKAKFRWPLIELQRMRTCAAALRVCTADGPPQRIWDKRQQHLPGDEAWLISEQRASGEKKYYLAQSPCGDRSAHTNRQHQGKMDCEQAHQQLKEEPGLDHFEGRSWRGLHRHALMTMIAYACLQHRRLAHASGKRSNGPPPHQPTMPAHVTPSSISSCGRRLNGVENPWKILAKINSAKVVLAQIEPAQDLSVYELIVAPMIMLEGTAPKQLPSMR